MEDLKSLIGVISKNKIKQIGLLTPHEEGPSNLQVLYEKLAKNEIESEEKAQDSFFGGTQNPRFYFSRLKRQLKDRLINTLFLIDVNQPNFNEYQRSYYNCYKNTTAAKILIGRGNRRTAIPLAEKTLKKAIKFEFTDIILSLAKDLRMHYGTIEGNQKKYKYYNKIVKEYIEVFNAELLAEEYYSDLQIDFVNSQSAKKEIIEVAKKYSSKLKLVTKKFTSYRLNFLSFLIFVIRYEVANDYENTIKESQIALDFFEQKEHLASKTAILIFLKRMFVCNIWLKNYESAELLGHKSLELSPPGSRNWYSILYYKIILSFHSKNFQDAHDTYLMASSHSAFTKQYQNISESWGIHEAFIYFFILIEKIDPGENSQFKSFRVTKFVNEVPTYSKDKRGRNIPILILHILLLLNQGKHGQIIDRMESLNTYTHRYLRKDDTFRSNCFIKMLMQLPAASFHKQGVIRKAKRYRDQLHTLPIEKANQTAEVEIVPYEMLWEFVLESLDDKFH